MIEVDEAFHDAEQPHAKEAAERFVVVHGPGSVSGRFDVMLETEPDFFVVLCREDTRGRAEDSAACYRSVLADVLITYAAQRKADATSDDAGKDGGA